MATFTLSAAFSIIVFLALLSTGSFSFQVTKNNNTGQNVSLFQRLVNNTWPVNPSVPDEHVPSVIETMSYDLEKYIVELYYSFL